MTADPACPAPLAPSLIQLAHGGGGHATWRLLHDVIRPALGIPDGEPSLDAAELAVPPGARLAFTTDASVVRPAFFPGGDIGRLAVFGTVNDLAVAGARPLALSLSLVLEEGLPLDTLRRVLASVAAAARLAGVRVVTGDTKVVDRGKGDGIYLSTAGIGAIAPGVALGPHRMRPGDLVLVSGDIGRHGVAILSVRDGIAFESAIESDCAPVTGLVDALLAAGCDLRCLRDPTRGGVSAALHELAIDGGVEIALREPEVPVDRAVAAACELLGLDPLAMACEGRLVAIVAPDHAERALAALRSRPDGARAAAIGRVEAGTPGRVVAQTALGTRRILDFAASQQLPRIC
ncbi:MAG TPA: hydrogenase expression/formation protein HypE [Kofleriaceae bacterium]|nr:hydrogenase expression/formation protein HypE [Kofleriaceae bacterium]